MFEREILINVYGAVDDHGKVATDGNCTACLMNVETVHSLLLIDFEFL
jgi:hypothetical protein